VRLKDLVDHLDRLLSTADITDYPGALNGLQVDSTREEIGSVALAVDASQATIETAVQRGAELLIVHHGLFWDGTQPLVGRRYRRVKGLLDANLALYSSHLPLDVHATLGNNAVLARQLGISVEGVFGEYKGRPIGVWGTLELRREALAARLDEVLGGRVRMIAGGPEKVRRVGVLTGGAGSLTGAAVAAGLDAFITGEGAHHNYFDAVEGGVNLYLGGHYATEVWGVRALGDHLRAECGVETVFIDNPTGM
jgi:dinuclear metal center YbgI/SA1388 family protein